MTFQIIPLSFFFCFFESGKCGKEWGKIQKFEYLENEKWFLDKVSFYSFFKKIKNKSDTNFKFCLGFLQLYRIFPKLLK